MDVNAVNEGGQTALHMACRRGHADVVRTLVAAPGIDVNLGCVRAEGEPAGRTPLHVAAAEGNVEVVRALLEAPGVRVLARDSGGSTALDLASGRSHAGVAALLDEAATAVRGTSRAPRC